MIQNPKHSDHKPAQAVSGIGLKHCTLRIYPGGAWIDSKGKKRPVDLDWLDKVLMDKLNEKVVDK